MNICEVRLSDSDADLVCELGHSVLAAHGGESWDELLRASSRMAGQLPASITDAFYDMRVRERYEAVLVSGFPYDETKAGPTPPRHRGADDRSLNGAEAMHLVLSSALGDPFGFESQQHGNFLNHIIPIAELSEVANASAGSTYDFELHTEDAFHEYAPDFLGLFCLRNRERATTGLSSIRDCTLTDRQKEILRQPQYRMSVNALHQGVQEQIFPARAVLFGDEADPYMRINSYMDLESITNDEAREAALSLIEQLRARRTEYTLEPGQAVYIDNLRAAHSRKRYVPSSDGHARWLCRIPITRDMRKSRAWRASAASRTILLTPRAGQPAAAAANTP